MNLRQALLAAALIVATPAHAATYLITYTGQADVNYIFSDLPSIWRTTFTAVYTLNLPSPGAQMGDDGTVGYIQGSKSQLSAALTIHASAEVPSEFNFTFFNYSKGLAYQTNGLDNPGSYLDYDLVQHEIQDFRASISLFGKSDKNDIVKSSNITAPLDYTVQDGDTAGGKFNYIPVRPFAGTLYPQRIAITAAGSSPVPETATWTMMLLGFGAIGFAMRHRHRSLTADKAYASGMT